MRGYEGGYVCGFIGRAVRGDNGKDGGYRGCCGGCCYRGDKEEDKGREVNREGVRGI